MFNNAQVFSSLFSNKELLAQIQKLYDARELICYDIRIRDSEYFHMYREQMAKKNLGRNGEGFDKMHKIEKENVSFFNSFLDNGMFPSEQMIGLYTEDDKELFFKKYNLESFEPQLPSSLKSGNSNITLTGMIPDDYQLSNNAALLSYLHYPCVFESNKEKFWHAVKNGYFYLKDYCMMEEWFAKSLKNKNSNHDCMEMSKTCCYNIIYELRVSESISIA